MSMGDLKRREKKEKTFAGLALAGSVVSFVFFGWLLGVILLGVAGYFGWKAFKTMAETGGRF